MTHTTTECCCIFLLSLSSHLQLLTLMPMNILSLYIASFANKQTVSDLSVPTSCGMEITNVMHWNAVCKTYHLVVFGME